MRSAAISKLKATLSEYITFVKAGEEVLVTERGKAVAKIVPVQGVQKDDAKRMELIRRGILRPGKGVSRETLQGLPVAKLSREDILRTIDEEREETA